MPLTDVMVAITRGRYWPENYRWLLAAQCMLTLGVGWVCYRWEGSGSAFIYGGQANPMIGLVFALFAAGVCASLSSDWLNIHYYNPSKRTTQALIVSSFLLGASIVSWFTGGARYFGGIELSLLFAAVANLVSFLAARSDPPRRGEEGDEGFWQRCASQVYFPTFVGLTLIVVIQLLFTGARHPEFNEAWNRALPKPGQVRSLTFWSEYLGHNVLPLQIQAFWDGFGAGAAAIQILSGQLAGYAMRWGHDPSASSAKRSRESYGPRPDAEGDTRPSH